VSACAWCREPVSATKRRDAKFCSKRCRQAHWRFAGHIRTARRSSDPRKIGYADPPYPGKSGYYKDHPDYGGEVDHAELIASLEACYDGWALSTSSVALPTVLGLCPPKVRVAAWFRGSRPTSSRFPLQAWEPVIYRPARAEVSPRPGDDALVHVSRPRTTDPGRVIGAKPAAFCQWLFELLAAQAQDDFVDLFPGSRGVMRAWELFSRGCSSDASR
jgi:hypothetical protein